MKKKRKKINKKGYLMLMLLGLCTLLWNTYVTNELVKMYCEGFPKFGVMINIIGSSFLAGVGFLILIFSIKGLIKKTEDERE